MDPGNGGERPSRNQPRSDYISAVQLSASQNEDLLRRARNAERKRRSRQSQQSNETVQEAALRRARHAEEVRNWYQSRQANETTQEAASRSSQDRPVGKQSKIWFRSRL